MCPAKCKGLTLHCCPKMQSSLWGCVLVCIPVLVFHQMSQVKVALRLGPASYLHSAGEAHGLHRCVLKGLCACPFLPVLLWEEVSKKIRKHFDMDKNENTTY